MKLLLAFLSLSLIAGPLAFEASAKPPRPGANAPAKPGQSGKPGKPGKKAPGKLKKKILEKFDADGDGKLSPEEKAKAKAWKKAKREKKQQRRQQRPI